MIPRGIGSQRRRVMTKTLLYAIFVLVCVIFCVTLVTNVTALWRGDVPGMAITEKWIWNYDTPRWAWLVPAILGVVIYVGGAVVALSHAPDHGRYPLRLMLWAFGGAALISLLLLTLEGPPLYLLFTRTASPGTGGYEYAAWLANDDFAGTLREWPDFIRGFHADPPGGFALSPPGHVVLYYAANQLLEHVPLAADQLGALVRPQQCQNLTMMTWSNAELASAWGQIFMPLWAALAVVPLYTLGARLFDRRRARLAVLLWPLVPGMVIFTPRFNVFYPLITLVMLLALWRGLARDRARWIALSGFVVSVGILFNLSLVPLGLLAGLILIGWRLMIEPRRWTRLARDLVVFGIGCASSWLIYWALSGESPLALIRFLFNEHADLNRPYLPWVFLHPYDMFLFAGLPVAIFAIWRMVRTRYRAVTPADVLAGAAGLTIIILSLSGTGRGETGRVWLFFAPIWILLAADVVVQLSQRQQAGVVALQALCLVSMAAVLRGNFTAYTQPPNPPAAQQDAAFPLNAQFQRGDDRVTLVGLSLDTAPNALTLYLHWRATSRVERPYVLSLVGIGPDGQTTNSLNWDPLDWNYPPSCWAPGREFVDTVRVPLDTPGNWLFSLSISDVFTHDTMTVTSADGSIAQQVGIGPVSVP
jgi:hypothetical protein